MDVRSAGMTGCNRVRSSFVPRPARGRGLVRTLCTGALAFTLVELLTVIGIIVILASIMVPVVNTLTKGNSQKQAVNVISTYLSAARAIAMSEGRHVGVVFYEDSSDTNQTAMQLVGETSYSASTYVMSFDALKDKFPQFLPRGVKVGTLDDSATSTFRSDMDVSGTPNTSSRIILFDGNGQLTLTNGLAYATSSTTTTLAQRQSWQLNATSGNLANGVSSPGVVIYDANELKAYDDSQETHDSATRAAWIKAHADVLVINANTGMVIR